MPTPVRFSKLSLFDGWMHTFASPAMTYLLFLIGAALLVFEFYTAGVGIAGVLGAGGDFARLYVVAHEYGHHIQTLTGLAGQVRSAQQQNPRRANQLQVRMELQADCYAGVWAGKNRNRIEEGDFEEGMRAAAAIGDDAISERMGGRVSPENFTHGTSEQRMEALRLGMRSGDDTVCDRYFAPESF